MKNQERLKNLSQDYCKFLELYQSSRDRNYLFSFMILLNTFDKGVMMDNNLTQIEKDAILSINEYNIGII